MGGKGNKRNKTEKKKKSESVQDATLKHLVQYSLLQWDSCVIKIEKKIKGKQKCPFYKLPLLLPWMSSWGHLIREINLAKLEFQIGILAELFVCEEVSRA